MTPTNKYPVNVFGGFIFIITVLIRRLFDLTLWGYLFLLIPAGFVWMIFASYDEWRNKTSGKHGFLPFCQDKLSSISRKK